jgi:hypothetical protein
VIMFFSIRISWRCAMRRFSSMKCWCCKRTEVVITDLVLT